MTLQHLPAELSRIDLLVCSALDLPCAPGPERLARLAHFAAARAHPNPNLAGLARKFTPRYAWSNIIQ